MEYQINLVTIVFKDNRYGNVYRQQKEWLEGRFIVSDLCNPDFVKIAELECLSMGKPWAVPLANGTDFGLAASVWTGDINRAMRATRRLRCGIVWVNTHNIPDLAMPIGGYGQSGWGRELGQMGILNTCNLSRS